MAVFEMSMNLARQQLYDVAVEALTIAALLAHSRATFQTRLAIIIVCMKPSIVIAVVITLLPGIGWDYCRWRDQPNSARMQLGMESRFKPVITAATALAILLAIAVALFALQLLIVGVPVTIVAEIPEGTQELPGMVNVAYAPYPFAVGPLIAMILFIGGLLTQKLLASWVGWAILTIFTVFFLFSSGAALLPAVGVLLVLLTIISYARRHLY